MGEGRICLASTASAGVGCTADCSAGGFASCQSTTPRSSGPQTVALGAAGVTVAVPGTVPFGGTRDARPSSAGAT